MKLQYISDYLSISKFDDVELPPFTVLTGVNGSGKSHLLKAIELKHVNVLGLDNPNIIHFDYESFRLDNESAFNAHQLSSEREAAWGFFEQKVKPTAVSWRASLGESYARLKDRCVTKGRAMWYVRNDESIKPYRKSVNNHFYSQRLRQDPSARGIHSLIKKLPYSIDEITHDDFLDRYEPYSYKQDFLPMQIGKIIWDYWVKFYQNRFHAYENEKNAASYNVLSEEEFRQTHGEKPWNLINTILNKFTSLDYKVNSPEGVDIFGTYQLKLVHTQRPNLEIDFSSLSTGERVLMALVASVYKASSDHLFPDLLLLDEIDTSLHPSMIQNMLDVIETIFLEKEVKVILVTHSPTTIALCPDASIFVMNKEGENRIEPKSRQQAVSILTEGFATLEQGIKLFDQISKEKISIITEGNNAGLIRLACELAGCGDVEVVSGVEGSSGKNHLRTIFDFFAAVPHEKPVLVVWDCDVTFNLNDKNRTHSFILSKNTANGIATKGIENAFPEELFANFLKKIIMSNSSEKTEFDDTRKKDFAEFVIGRNDKEDFQHFQPLIEKIKSIKAGD